MACPHKCVSHVVGHQSFVNASKYWPFARVELLDGAGACELEQTVVYFAAAVDREHGDCTRLFVSYCLRRGRWQQLTCIYGGTSEKSRKITRFVQINYFAQHFASRMSTFYQQ